MKPMDALRFRNCVVPEVAKLLQAQPDAGFDRTERHIEVRRHFRVGHPLKKRKFNHLDLFAGKLLQQGSADMLPA